MTTRNLMLRNIVLMVGEDVIDQNVLNADARQWQGYAMMPGIGKQYFQLPDLTLTRILANAYMPFTLSATAPTVIAVTLAKFPYSINGDKAFQAFSLRLVPMLGRISELTMHARHELAVNLQSFSPEGISMDMGNGAVHVEVYYSPVDSGSLQPLSPPAGYRAEVVFDPNDYN